MSVAANSGSIAPPCKSTHCAASESSCGLLCANRLTSAAVIARGPSGSDQQTVTEDAPGWLWNAQWRRIFGTSALLEAKFTGYDGYYYLDPVDPSVYTVDAETGTYSGWGGSEDFARLYGPNADGA